jgi:chorismate mutase/prephenate dehydratase
VIFELSDDNIDLGVVPIENSTFGSVYPTLNGFIEGSADILIVEEIFLDIHHYLLTNETEIGNIKKVYSHSQV